MDAYIERALAIVYALRTDFAEFSDICSFTTNAPFQNTKRLCSARLSASAIIKIMHGIRLLEITNRPVERSIIRIQLIPLVYFCKLLRFYVN